MKHRKLSIEDNPGGSLSNDGHEGLALLALMIASRHIRKRLRDNYVVSIAQANKSELQRYHDSDNHGNNNGEVK